MHWAHATGFNAATYLPLLRRLAGHFNVLAWDMRGHGESTAMADPDRLRNWEPFYEDLTQYLGSLDGPLLLAGHSVGAVCSLFAASRLGSRVRGLCLVDPILMCGTAAAGFGLMKRLGLGDRHPLVSGALRRRRAFGSWDDALRTYAGKQVFADWEPAFLAAYVEGGLKTTADGVELRCAPAWEARQFATTEHDPWPPLRDLQSPVLLVQAERASTILPGAVRKFVRHHPDTRHSLYAGTSHFVPMETSGRLSEDMASFLADACP